MAFKVKAVRPLFTGVITTAKTFVGEIKTKGGIIVDTTKLEGTLNPLQTVVAVGNTVHDVAPGDIVKINFKRYEKAKHVPGAIDEGNNIQRDNYSVITEVPSIMINDVEHLFLQVNDIEYVITDYDVDGGGLLQ